MIGQNSSQIPLRNSSNGLVVGAITQELIGANVGIFKALDKPGWYALLGCDFGDVSWRYGALELT